MGHNLALSELARRITGKSGFPKPSELCDIRPCPGSVRTVLDLVQPLLLQPLGDHARDLRDVRIRHRIVRVSADADVRQNNVPDVAAVFVSRLRKQLVLLDEDTPGFRAVVRRMPGRASWG